MSNFLLAVQFLTILPLKIRNFNDKKMAWALIYFPVVGLFIGSMLLGLNTLLSILGISPAVANIILVIVLIILTGGMHLDGLADTADAFLSGKAKKEMLEIMRDSHVGVMGVLALISIILLKIGLLSSVYVAVKPVALILMCILSRWSVVLIMYLFPYARQEGKARLFIQGMNSKIFILSTIVVVICSFLIWYIPGLIALSLAALCAYAIGKFVSRKIGGVTGDTLGATIELTEIATLLTVCIAQKLIYG
ncbi:MAG: adenosylcobinamide-GDP ribazoletransferase [Candidatus Omnitrophica bacterium]|nr:adenosylcobinamide-GDP ribazoletransferase [Candidatus Omnitrophota bacterium]MBU1924001.1 adenosylcobinamide-GDP ribazoletransferase [Candidatus Omnitrophota bacterium]